MITAIQPKLISGQTNISDNKKENKTNRSNVSFSAIINFHANRLGESIRADNIKKAEDKIKNGGAKIFAGILLVVLGALDANSHFVGWKDTMPDTIGIVTGLLSIVWGWAEIGAGGRSKARWSED